MSYEFSSYFSRLILRDSYLTLETMPKNSILILLGIVEIIILTLVGLYFLRLTQEEEQSGNPSGERGMVSSVWETYLV